jgi:hypothetical protein
VDGLIFAAVVLARVAVPLAILRFPLPAMLAALVIDGVDQTIFQTFTNLDLSGYQSYDKALDVYYLSIAYIATLRNWTSLSAFGVGYFLYYYRLVGVVLFELTQLRWVLFVFPNTFEYFFDFYEAVRTRWDPRRMSRGLLIGAAAFIWIFIKLPQEWWIHVAQLDMTRPIPRSWSWPWCSWRCSAVWRGGSSPTVCRPRIGPSPSTPMPSSPRSTRRPSGSAVPAWPGPSSIGN